MSSHTRNPHQDPEEYRIQVQTRIQTLLSGDRPRDPHLSTVSTRRLILEGLVEEVKIYRLHKEDKARAEKEREKRRRRRMSSRSRHGGEERKRHNHHRRHHHRSHDRSRNTSRERHRSGDRSHGHKQSRRHESRDGSRDIPRQRSSHRHRDSVIEGPSDARPELQMSGGVRPAGSSSPPPPHHHQRRRSRSLRRALSPRRGPDGTTPFGQLPKKVAGVGFAAHLLNMYRHIKAEHEAGERTRSVVERSVDGWRGKGGGGGGGGEKGGSERKGTSEMECGRREKEDDRSRRGRERGERDRDGGRRRDGDGGSGRKYVSDRAQGLRRASRERSGEVPLHPAAPQIPPGSVHSRTPNSPAFHNQAAIPPTSAPPAWPPTPETFVQPAPARSRSTTPGPHYPPTLRSTTPSPIPITPPARSRSVTPLYSPPRSQSITPSLPYPPTSCPNTPSPIPMPPPPPPPKSPPHSALLLEIQSPTKLRKVASSDKHDKSSALSGHVYETAPYSRDVEAREREEKSKQEAWSCGSSDAEDEEGEMSDTERRRAFVETPNRTFGG
jgi:hypothetical protein